jgi:hypothetical protein
MSPNALQSPGDGLAWVALQVAVHIRIQNAQELDRAPCGKQACGHLESYRATQGITEQAHIAAWLGKVDLS